VGGKLFTSDPDEEQVGSWAYRTALIWTGAVYQSEVFHMFYLGEHRSELALCHSVLLSQAGADIMQIFLCTA
jgi:hypothetical protein